MAGTADVLLELVLHGREERNLEYKTAMNWKDAETKGKICKSSMAMANIKDGGDIVIGVSEKPKGTFVPDGLSEAMADSFKHDDISSYLNGFAAPYVEFSLQTVDHAGVLFVVIRVAEFGDLPVVCRKDGPSGLRRGAMYTRTRKKHETAEVSSEAEMREIFDLAVDKGIRTFLARAERAGMSAEPSAESRFDEELGGI